MARNERLGMFGDAVVGSWSVALTNAWFLDSMDVVQEGVATFSWLGEAFVRLEAWTEGAPTWDFVFGRSDAQDRFVALYHDPRGTSRVFDMTFTDSSWVLTRSDPDMHQRFVATWSPGAIEGHWDASDDGGQTWRKDFDLSFDRVG